MVDYPQHKLVLNRLANLFLRIIFHAPLNDFTNAFKAYRRKVIDGCRPFLSPHFNLTIEIPLKTIVRGYSWTVIPITWRNRRSGESKLRIKEMGSRYLFIALYCWLEKYFSRGDYIRKVPTRDELSRDREGVGPERSFRHSPSAVAFPLLPANPGASTPLAACCHREAR